MGIINEYLNRIKRKYPSTQAVKEQIEELRDTLNLKCEEYIKQGQPEEEAERSAVASLGDVSPLFEEISGNTRTVYINHLKRNNATFMFHLALFEMFALLLFSRFIAFDWWMVFEGEIVSSLPYIVILLGMGMWPLIVALKWKQNPKKTETKLFRYRKMMLRAVIGWLLISVAALVLGYILSQTATRVFVVIIGALNWPLGVFIYHKQFTGGFYDV